MSETIAAKLDEARALIETKGWTQRHYARGKSGKVVNPLGRAATCYCAAGAIGAVNHSWPSSTLLGMRDLARSIGGDDESDILSWNDAPERTQAEVIEAFRRAAELARAGQWLPAPKPKPAKHSAANLRNAVRVTSVSFSKAWRGG